MGIHMLTHTKVKAYECLVCHERFQMRDHLRKHSVLHDLKEKGFRCCICNASFGQIVSIKVHTLKHVGLKPFKCQICSKWFAEETYLRKHIKSQHAYKCDLYGK